MNRRTLLLTVGAAALGGCTGSSPGDGTTPTTIPTSPSASEEAISTATSTSNEPAVPANAPDAFVERDGTDFVVDGEPYRFSGVANCCLAKGYTSRQRVDSVMGGAAELGADVLRFKSGSAGARSDCGDVVDGCRITYQTGPGEYNETALKHLDYIIGEAGKRGMRVILPLVDNWGRDGMNQYVEWSDTASEHDDFYTDARAQELYRGFVEEVVTRTNTVTGRSYREDPTVLMWELANEPRVEEDYEGFLNWVEDTAGFIHDLDGQHLVSTGSDIYPAEAYETVHGVDGIDACSIHLWPQNWGKGDVAESFGRDYIADRAGRGMEKVGKPVYLGEYGVRVNLQQDDVEQQLQHRNELFEAWHEAVLESGIGGAIAWELLSDGRLEYHRTEPGKGETVGFACPQHGGTCDVLREFAQRIDERSAVA